MRLSGQSILASLMPQNLQNGMDPVTFQGLNPGGAEGVFGYDIPNLLIDHAMRNTHLTAGVLARRQHQPQHHLCGMLHRRAGPCGRSGSAGVSSQAVETEASGGARGGRRNGPAGAIRRPGGIRVWPRSWRFGSYVAACAEISVSHARQAQDPKIVAATNPGVAVNPAQIERQVAGSFVYGLSALLYGECTVKDGAVEQTNFDTYNVLRMDEMPEVEC